MISKWNIVSPARLCLATLCLTSIVDGGEVVAWRGATVETIGKAGRISNATVIVRDGKIEDVGADVEIPENARIVDAAGQTIMPAFIDPYHAITLGSAPAPTTRTVTIGGRTFTIPSATATTSTAFTRVGENVDPLALKSRMRPLARAGVGFANLVTRGYGQAAHASVTPDVPETILKNAEGYLFVAVTNSSSSLGVLRSGLGSGSSSRSGSSDPRAALRERLAGRRPPGAPSGSSSRSSSSRSTSVSGKLWQAVREGKAPLVVNVNNAAAILHLLEILKPHSKVRVVMVANGPHVYQTLDQLKGKNIAVVLRPGIDLVPFSQNRMNVAKIVHEAGVDFGFSLSLTSDTSDQPDTPLFPVSLLVKSGLPREKALEALTLAPARMLGLEKTMGSIEKGKVANLLVIDGDPLDPATRIQQVLVEGRPVFEG